MEYFFSVVLLLLLLLVCLRWRRSQQQLEKMQREQEGLREQLASAEHRVFAVEERQKALWEYANTIHLYAALSEEEAKTLPLKEKQREILRETEKLLQQLKKEPEK